mgnify:CR=1 FL=1
MENGRIVQIGKPREIYFNPSNVYVASLFGEVNIFQLKNIYKAFRDPDAVIHVAQGLSWFMRTNESAALLGESGVGKTTVINLIAGLDSADSGEVIVDDLSISRLSDSSLAEFRRKKLGLIFQKFHLIPSLDSWDNAALQARLGQRFDPEFAEYLFESLSIGHLRHRYPSKLSGCQQQRVAIARAIINNPSILLADEPTGALDSKTTEDVLDLFDKLHESGITIVLVTHEDEVANRAKKIAKFKDGRIVELKVN